MPLTGFAAISPPSPWNIVVLAGGDSAEREISLQSGSAVANALQRAGHLVQLVDPGDVDLTMVNWKSVNMTFIALHGTHGEDGTVQRQLESLNVPYTGSGPEASRLAFHKLEAKKRFLECGLPTPAYCVIEPEDGDQRILEACAEIGTPIVVKPEAQGSSLGVSILSSSSGLAVAVEHARELDELVLLERFIAGQEWTVPVLDDAALWPIRIGTPHEFFDFHAKYFDTLTQYEVVADPQDATVLAVQQLALQACASLGCRGMSRVDLRVDPAGQAWILEVNTIPGMTDHSLVPKSAAAQGWTMSRLCEEIILSAWRVNRT